MQFKSVSWHHQTSLTDVENHCIDCLIVVGTNCRDFQSSYLLQHDVKLAPNYCYGALWVFFLFVKESDPSSSLLALQALAAIPSINSEAVQQRLDHVRTYFELLNMPYEARHWNWYFVCYIIVFSCFRCQSLCPLCRPCLPSSRSTSTCSQLQSQSFTTILPLCLFFFWWIPLCILLFIYLYNWLNSLWQIR